MASRIKRALFCAAGMAALCSISQGQITKAGHGYLLRVHYTKGMVMKYDSTTTVKGGGLSVSPFHVGLTVEVTKVVRGVGTVKITQGKVMLDGKMVMAPSTVVVPLDSRNTGNTKAGQSALGPPMPARSIVPGSHWEAKMPVTLLGTARIMDMRYQFSAMTRVKGHPMALILFHVSGPVEGEGKMYLRASDGTLQSSDMTLSLGAGLTGASSMAVGHFVIKRL